MTDKLRDDIAQPMRLSRAYDRGREMMVRQYPPKDTDLSARISLTLLQIKSITDPKWGSEYDHLWQCIENY